MKYNIKIMFAMIIMPIIVACDNNQPIEEAIEQVVPNEITAIPIEVTKYTILNDDIRGNIKRTVEVELPERLDETELRELAQRIKKLSDADVERTFIGYRIAGTDPTQAYWATTHYNPNLEVIILGQNATDYEKIKDTDLPEGDVLGSWMINRGIEYKITAYKKDGVTYIENKYGDDTSSKDAYVLTEIAEGTKLQMADDTLGEYFIINPQGDLEFWSNNGNYYTAKNPL